MILKKPTPFYNRLGQSVLEYLLLFVVIIIGIVVGGPFLIRSVQGHYKLLEESTQDSLSEDIKPAIITSTVYPACSCDPNSLDPHDWPGYQCGGTAAAPGCAPTERYHHRLCHPLRCAQENACVWDADCCSAPQALDCGLKAPSQCDSRAPINSHFTGGSITFTGTCKKSGVDTEDCGIGERRYRVSCGDAGGVKSHYACNTDLDHCLPVCWDRPQFNTKTCDGYPESNYVSPYTQSNPSRLLLINGYENRRLGMPNHPYSFYQAIQDVQRVNAVQMNYRYVATSADCNSNDCERICRTGYYPNSTHSACLKSFCWHWIYDNNVCSLGSTPTFCTGIQTCSYIAACIDTTTGAPSVLSGTGGAFRQITTGSCEIYENTTYFNGHIYCYYFSGTTPLAIPGPYTCDNNYLFFSSEGCS